MVDVSAGGRRSAVSAFPLVAGAIVVLGLAAGGVHADESVTLQHPAAGGLTFIQATKVRVLGAAGDRVTVSRCLDDACLAREMMQLKPDAEGLTIPRVPAARETFHIEKPGGILGPKTDARAPSRDVVIAVLGPGLFPAAHVEVPGAQGAVTTSAEVVFAPVSPGAPEALLGYDAVVVAEGHVPGPIGEAALMRFLHYGGIVFADADWVATHGPQTERMKAFEKVFASEGSPKRDPAHVVVNTATLVVDEARVPLRDGLDAGLDVLPTGGGALLARSPGMGVTATAAMLLALLPLRQAETERPATVILDWAQRVLFAESERLFNIERGAFLLGVLLLTLAFAFVTRRRGAALTALVAAGLAFTTAFVGAAHLPASFLKLAPPVLDVSIAVGPRGPGDGAAHFARMRRVKLGDVGGRGAEIRDDATRVLAVLAGRAHAKVERTGAKSVASWSAQGDIITLVHEAKPGMERLAFAPSKPGQGPHALHLSAGDVPQALFVKVREGGKTVIKGRDADSASSGTYALDTFRADHPARAAAVKAARALAEACPARVWTDVDCAVAVDADNSRWRVHVAFPGARYVDSE